MKKLLLSLLFAASAAFAQDTRTVVEPTIPTGCTQITALKYSVYTTAVNLDPYGATAGAANGGTGTQGTLGATGAGSWEPSSSSSSYVAAETLDNTTTGGGAGVMTAIKNAPSGGCVELMAASTGQNAFVMGQWTNANTANAGIKVVIDAGVTVYESRNPSDFVYSACGTVSTTALTNCEHWFIPVGVTGGGLYGYGVLDGRGWDRFITNSTCGGVALCGFDFNRAQSYNNVRGAIRDGSPNGPIYSVSSTNDKAYGPDSIHIKGATNFTMYKLTLRGCTNFCIYIGDSTNGATFWDVTVIAPFEISNTDGFDPSYNTQNITMIHSRISNGDNQMAIKSDCGSSCQGYTGGATKNITLEDITTSAGIGLTVGVDTSGGVSNVLVDTFVQRGNQNNAGQQEGHGVQSINTQGGLVNNVTFQNGCVMNETQTLLYSTGGTGTMYPQFSNIVERNIHVLNGGGTIGGGPSSGNSGELQIDGESGEQTGITLDNFIVDGSITDSYAYDTITFGPGPVSTNVLNTLPPTTSHTGVTTTNSISTSPAPYACTTASYKPLIGQLLIQQNSAVNNIQGKAATPYTIANGSSFVLQAVIEPITDISIKEGTKLSQPITFYDNGTSIGTGTIGGNGTLATKTVTASGSTHVYTASYPGDTAYPGVYTFGSVNVSVTGGTVSSVTLSPSQTNAQMQAAINSVTPGGTVTFAAGNYVTTAQLSLPCTGGTLYTGPNVGLVTTTNLPTAVLNTNTTNTIFYVASNSATSSYGSGCSIKYLEFYGTGGDIFIHYPSYGVTIDSNAFTGNNPIAPVTQGNKESNIWVDGSGSTFNAANGANYTQITNNVSFNNCASIQAYSGPTDEGGYCNLAMVGGYNNYFLFSNNTIAGTEQGLKWVERTATGSPIANNATVTNNNISGFSRIGFEAQQITNGNVTVSHNAVYQPTEPSNLTFSLSLPAATGCTSPCWTIQDNALINGVAVYENGSPSTGFYGDSLEIWGAGLVAQYNLLQGGNSTTLNCHSGSSYKCSTGVVSVGGSYTNATINNNFFSGWDYWNGTANDTGRAIGYEDGATISNTGLVLSPNTVVLTSAAIVSPTPTISITGTTVTLAVPDVNRTYSIFYTLDGTTPVPFVPGGSAGTTQLYTAPFSVSAGVTVEAIAQWGQGANQGIVFPQFGYVPSLVASNTPIPVSNTQSTYGITVSNVTATINPNLTHNQYFISGTVPQTVQSCFFYQTGVGTPGAQISCGIVAAPTPTTEASSYVTGCYGTYTETSVFGTYVIIPFSCQLAANTPYWIVINTNDTSVTTGRYNCGSSCTGNATSGAYPFYTSASTFGALTGLPSSLTGTQTTQYSVYIVTNPTANTSVHSIGQSR